MSVKDLFRGGADHTGLIINAVLGQMSAFEEETGMPLYKGWREEIEKSVLKDRFYLADDGIALYVPQGSITADIWGVPTFLINYKELNGRIKRILL